MTRICLIWEGGEEFYYRTKSAVRVAPIYSVKMAREGHKRKELTGFYLLNGEHRPGEMEVPARMWIFRSGLDLSKMPAHEKYGFMGMKERELEEENPNPDFPTERGKV